jgi:hypothetical protein
MSSHGSVGARPSGNHADLLRCEPALLDLAKPNCWRTDAAASGRCGRAAGERLQWSRPCRDRIALRPATPSTASVAIAFVAFRSPGSSCPPGEAIASSSSARAGRQVLHEHSWAMRFWRRAGRSASSLCSPPFPAAQASFAPRRDCRSARKAPRCRERGLGDDPAVSTRQSDQRALAPVTVHRVGRRARDKRVETVTVIYRRSESIDSIDDTLTLTGLRLIWERNARSLTVVTRSLRARRIRSYGDHR